LLKAQLVNIKSPICKNEAQQNGGSILKPKPILAEKRHKETVNNITETNNIELTVTFIIFLVSFFISSRF
jgi:hypothetical protein